MSEVSISAYDPEEYVDDYDVVTEVDSVRAYLNAINKTPLLSASEEVELAQQIEAGVYAERLLENTDAQTALEADKGFKRREFMTDEEESDLKLMVQQGKAAQDHFWRANLRLAVARAKRRGNSDLELLDRIQEANIGLLRAIQKFDYTQGNKFSTYAIAWLDQKVERGIKDKAGNIRLPQYFGEDVDRIERSKRELLQLLGREATSQEIALDLDMSVDKVLDIQHVAYITKTRSLDVPIDEGKTLLEFIDQERTDNSEMRAMENAEYRVGELMTILTEREKDIVSAYHGLGPYMEAPQSSYTIAKKYGISRERVNKIERDARKKMLDRANYLQCNAS